MFQIISNLQLFLLFKPLAFRAFSYQSHHARSMETCITRFTLEYAFVERVNWFVVSTQLANKSLSFADLKENCIIIVFLSEVLKFLIYLARQNMSSEGLKNIVEIISEAEVFHTDKIINTEEFGALH